MLRYSKAILKWEIIFLPVYFFHFTSAWKSSLELCAKFNAIRIFLYYCENGPTVCRLSEQIYNQNIGTIWNKNTDLRNCVLAIVQSTKNLNKQCKFIGKGVCSRLKQVRKDFTRTANLHLLFPVLAYRAFTNGAVDKPAEISDLKFPGRTLFPLVARTFFYCPARLFEFIVFPNHGDQEKYLPLRRRWNRPPPLFVALDSLNGGSEQLAHLPLGLVQCISVMDEFFTVHGQYQGPCNWRG